MALIKNLVVDQGSTFSYMIQVTGSNKLPFNFSNYTLEGVIRKAPTSQNVAATFTILVPTPTDGKIFLTLTDEETAVIKPGRYQYDVISENLAGERFRTVEGIVTVTPSITR